MLLLVVADGDVGRPVEQDVSRHEARIGEQAQRGVLAVLAGLFLELRHAVHPADARHAVEHPGELGMAGNAALVEDDMLLRVDAGSEERGGDRPGLLPQVVMDELGRDRVQVDDAVDAVVALLQGDELADRAEIIAQMQIARGLHAGKDAGGDVAHGRRLRNWQRGRELPRVMAEGTGTIKRPAPAQDAAGGGGGRLRFRTARNSRRSAAPVASAKAK